MPSDSFLTFCQALFVTCFSQVFSFPHSCVCCHLNGWHLLSPYDVSVPSALTHFEPWFISFSLTPTSSLSGDSLALSIKYQLQFSSVQLLSRVWFFATPWIAACQASLSITNSWSLPKLMSIESVMPSSHLILRRPLLFLPSIFPSITVSSVESVLHIRWPKYWSFSFNISPSNEYSGLISFRIDWLDLLAVQGLSRVFSNTTKASILWCSAFFTVQLSYPYMTTGKTIALTRQTYLLDRSNVSAF